MVKSKYAQYIKPAPLEQSRFKQIKPLMVHQYSQDFWNAGHFSMGWSCVTEPFALVADAHSHTYEQYYVFVGGNSMNVSEFDAEIEIYMGEEQERFLIDYPVMLYIPPGLVHCPLTFTRVTKPIMYMDFALASRPDFRAMPKQNK